MGNDYISIMVQSLQKKLEVLNGIIEKNVEQRQILEQEELDTDAFEQNIKLKSDLVDQIEFLDDGFEELYGRVNYG